MGVQCYKEYNMYIFSECAVRGAICVWSYVRTFTTYMCKRVDHVTIVGDCFDVSGVALMC